jgi:hypothetical protein
LFALVAIAGLVFVDSASANSWTVALPNSQRGEAIHSMDIMERPNRPLHVYGDFVRLRNRR